MQYWPQVRPKACRAPVLMCIIFTKTDIMMISRGHTAQQTHRHTHTIIITVIICIRRYLSNFFFALWHDFSFQSCLCTYIKSRTADTLKLWSVGQFTNYYVKVRMLWKGHTNLKQSQTWFEIYLANVKSSGRLFRNLWPF